MLTMKIKKISVILTVFIVCLSSTTIGFCETTNSYEEEPIIVLVIGFGPFLNFSVNPSELIAEELDGEVINNAEVVGLQIQPNLSNFSESIEIAYDAIDCYNPSFIFPIGLAAPYDKIRIEKIGYNLKIENKSNATVEKLIPNGRWIRISDYPALKIVINLEKNGIPSQIAFYPGLSLCNGMLYSLLHYIDVNNLDIKSGFIHVPLHKSDENPDGMELETMVNATRMIIEITMNHYS